MIRFRKAVCLAVMIAATSTGLDLKAADPVLTLPPPAPATPPAPPAPRVDADPMNMIPGAIILDGHINGLIQQEQVILLGEDGIQLIVPNFVRAAPRLDPSAQDLVPIVGEGFASDRPVKGSLDPILEALNADSYAERAKASDDLMHLPPDRLPDVVAALAHERDPEAVVRLKQVAGHLFLKPRTNVKGGGGFLGIGAAGPFTSLLGMRFENADRVRLPGEKAESIVVRISELQPGFPAAQDLRAGDGILAIAGRALPDELYVPEISVTGFIEEDAFIATSLVRQRQNEAKQIFQSRIRELAPGSVASFRILRDGQVMDINVQLAAMPESQRDVLAAIIDIRNQLMKEFVESLKTGEKSHAAAR